MSAGDFVNHLSEPVKHTVDVLSIGALIATLLSWVPAITALLVLLWTGLRIYESMLSIRERHLKLRQLYQSVMDEPVPPRLRKTLDDLK